MTDPSETATFMLATQHQDGGQNTSQSEVVLMQALSLNERTADFYDSV